MQKPWDWYSRPGYRVILLLSVMLSVGCGPAIDAPTSCLEGLVVDAALEDDLLVACDQFATWSGQSGEEVLPSRLKVTYIEDMEALHPGYNAFSGWLADEGSYYMHLPLDPGPALVHHEAWHIMLWHRRYQGNHHELMDQLGIY